MLRYFVDEWNVAESRTTIYIQPTNASHAIIPVFESDLLNARYALDVDYVAPDTANWLPIPEPATVLLVGLGGVALLRKRRA
ncbi:MAG: PEP-CTERM sorting domain-containing protein [Candidatus Bathyarchaeota archaeon]|nr:PEP-CTERM sorting domain-containing protein [Candidatus Bathyarchaeota archaeon]